MPLISVIVPVYCVERELPRCVESLLAQRYPRLEFLLIDDGSTDGSAALCDRYAAADERVRVCHQANAGVSTARNRGLEMAQGEFLCFVDSDDEVEPGYIDAFVQGIGPEVDVVFQGYCDMNGGNRLRKVPPRRLFKEGELTEAIATINRQAMFGYAWNKLFRRSVITEHGLRFRSDISLSEDRIFALEYLLHARRMQLVDAAYYRYYRQATGLSLRRRGYDELKAAADANLQAALALLAQQPSAGFERDTKRMYVAAAMGFLTALFTEGEPLARCIAAFREFNAHARHWLPLYHPGVRNYQVLYTALRLPAPAAARLVRLYWKLKHLKHELSA